MRPTWDDTWIGLCLKLSERSKDESTKVGCVIIGPNEIPRALGYNGIPRGCDDNLKHRHVRPNKYCYMEHAERNAIFNAARDGISLEGCKLYITAPPCADCSRAIIQIGVTKVICATDKAPDTWKCEIGLEMFKEAGVQVYLPNSKKPLKNYKIYNRTDKKQELKNTIRKMIIETSKRQLKSLRKNLIKRI